MITILKLQRLRKTKQLKYLKTLPNHCERTSDGQKSSLLIKKKVYNNVMRVDKN